MTRAPQRESIFTAAGPRFEPTEHASGPWDPDALHGGAPAALMTAELERLEPGAALQIARLGFEFLRPVPRAPLTLATRIVRPGRRVQELAAELREGDQLVARASALRVRPLPAEVLGAGAQGHPRPDLGELPARMAPPLSAAPRRFSLDGSQGPSFAASAMEMRWLGEPSELGPGRVWMRLRYPLLPGLDLTPLVRLAATADFANGVSAALPFERFLFINADLSVHLWRAPRGEWIGLDARTHLHDGGVGLAEAVLNDEHGVIGRAFQTLVVEPR